MTEPAKTSSSGNAAPYPIPDLAAEGHLIEANGSTYLCGARCRSCASLTFPFTPVCHRCGSRQSERVALAPAGVLYTYSTVHVSSSRPTPYSIGYVDLDDGVRVLAELRGKLAIGERVHINTDQSSWYFTAGEASR